MVGGRRPKDRRAHVTTVQAPVLSTAGCIFGGRPTPTDARALLTREIQKIQKIRQGSCDAVVDISINEDGLYESYIARMSIYPSRRVYFVELDPPAHLWLLKRRTVELRHNCLSIVLNRVLHALLHIFMIFVCSPRSSSYLWMVTDMPGYRRRMTELLHDPLL